MADTPSANYAVKTTTYAWLEISTYKHSYSLLLFMFHLPPLSFPAALSCEKISKPGSRPKGRLPPGPRLRKTGQ